MVLFAVRYFIYLPKYKCTRLRIVFLCYVMIMHSQEDSQLHFFLKCTLQSFLLLIIFRILALQLQWNEYVFKLKWN